MASPILGNSRAKLWRGNEQLYALYRDIQAVFDSKKHRTRFEAHSEPYPRLLGFKQLPWHVFFIYFADAPRLTKDFGVRVGEVLHNFRGCLDHLAWDLVHRIGKQNLDAKGRKAVQFPLTKNAANFWGDKRGGVQSQADRQLPGVPKDPYLTLIERYQPYRRSTVGRWMRALRNLSDIDKHRLILPTVMLPQRGQFEVKFDWGKVINWELLLKRGQAIKPGTKFARCIVAEMVTGQPIQMRVKGTIKTMPVFPRSYVMPPPGDDAVLIDWLMSGISSTCLEILNEVEEHLKGTSGRGQLAHPLRASP